MSENIVSFIDICQIMDSLENPILIDRITLEMVGDLASAAVLSRLRYWFSPSKKSGQQRTVIRHDGKTWVARTKDEWWEECGVTEKQIERISKELIKHNLVEVKYFRFNGLRMMHWSLNFQEYANKFNEASKKVYGKPQKGHSESPKGAVRNAPKGPSYNTTLKQSSYTYSLNNTPTPLKKPKKRFSTSSVQVLLLNDSDFEECFFSQQTAYEWLRNFGYDEEIASDLLKHHFKKLKPAAEYLKKIYNNDKNPISCMTGYFLNIIQEELYLKFRKK